MRDLGGGVDGAPERGAGRYHAVQKLRAYLMGIRGRGAHVTLERRLRSITLVEADVQQRGKREECLHGRGGGA